jgi:hypothetical protein
MNEPNYEIESTLVLSTAHIPQKDAVLLDAGVADAKVCVYKYEYGWLIGTSQVDWLTQDERVLLALDLEKLGFTPILVDLLCLARNLDCAYLRLDCDGPLEDSLVKFNW